MREYMTMKKALLLLVVAAAACSVHRPATTSLRPAENPPDHFVVGTPDGDETSESGASPVRDCRSPMVDPRDGTKLRLVWSSGGQGEYEVLPGRYGVGSGEVLRLDCATGRVLGIATRRP